jgi:hypothetical protein
MQCIPVVFKYDKLSSIYMYICGLTQLCLLCLYKNVPLVFLSYMFRPLLIGHHQAYIKRCLYTISLKRYEIS